LVTWLSYDEIITKMIEEQQEPLTKEEIEDIQEGLEDVKAGRVIPIEKAAKRYGIKLKA